MVIARTMYTDGIERESRKVFIVPIFRHNATTIARIRTETTSKGTTLIITNQMRASNHAITSLEDMERVT